MIFFPNREFTITTRGHKGVDSRSDANDKRQQQSLFERRLRLHIHRRNHNRIQNVNKSGRRRDSGSRRRFNGFVLDEFIHERQPRTRYTGEDFGGASVQRFPPVANFGHRRAIRRHPLAGVFPLAAALVRF